MDAVHVVGYVEEEGVQDLAECREVVVGQLPYDRLKGGGRGGEEGCNLFRSHFRNLKCIGIR